MRKLTVALAALCGVLLLTAGSCDSEPSAQSREQATRQNGYDSLVAGQPAHTMGYSPTRATLNFWIDTWSKPGKVSYVYLQSATGKLIGYYVLEGLPVNYCASLTPTYDWVDRPDDASNTKVQAPAAAVDGAYYSGGQCNSYYGKDATTGAYIEYTAGLGINVLLYDQPLPRQDVQPLGPSRIGDVK